MDHPLLKESEVDVTLFVACYNEEKNITPTLETTVAACEAVGCSYEIIVVDDGSRDRSVEVVEEYRRNHVEYPIRLVRNVANRGLAYNYVEAAFLGRGKYYRLVCGDNVEPKETQIAILRKMGTADIIVPYPVQVQNKALYRKVLSRAYTFLVNLLSGYRLPYWNGLALHQRYNVMRWHSNTWGFGFQAELLFQLLIEGKTWSEVGGIYHERTHGKAKAMTFRNWCSVTHSLLSIFLRRLGYVLFRRTPILVSDPRVTGLGANRNAAGSCEEGVSVAAQGEEWENKAA